MWLDQHARFYIHPLLSDRTPKLQRLERRTMHLTKLTLGLLACCWLATNVFAANPVHHNSALQESLGFPFSEAVQVGDTLYLSGQVHLVSGRHH